jgi:histidyl-tRNA synthetase
MSMGSGHIQPRLLKGFCDYLPQQMIARQRLVDTIRQCYEAYGFVPLDTPCQEYTLTLLGKYGDESNKQIYRLQSPEGEDVALRFDLTVPLARVVAQYTEIPKPFKRYQVGLVWRADKPDPGRFREFMQFDLDIVGCESVSADAEIMLAMYDTLIRLGIERFAILFNSRHVLNGVVAYAGIKADEAIRVFRVLDKLEKIGADAVKKELMEGRVDVSGDRIPGLGLSAKQVGRIEEFIKLPSGNRAAVLKALRGLLSKTPEAEQGISELEEMSRYLDELKIPEDKAAIQPSLARGLDYYTGPIYEARLLDAAQFGSVFAGGRYDGLVERFTGEKIPATGASVGVDRLLSALEFLKLIPETFSPAQVIVTVMDRSRMAGYMQFARELRQAGIATELYTGAEQSLGKQLQYANALRIPVAVIAGEDEFKNGTVSVKDLRAGMKARKGVESRDEWRKKGTAGQISVPQAELVSAVQKLLGDSAQ